MPIQNEKFSLLVSDSSGNPLTGSLVELRKDAMIYTLTEVGNGWYSMNSIPTGKYSVFVDSVDTGETKAVGSGQVAALGNTADSVPVSDATEYSFQDPTTLKTTLSLNNVTNVAVPSPTGSDANKVVRVDSNGDYVLASVTASGFESVYEILTTADLTIALSDEYDSKLLVISREDFNFTNAQTFEVWGSCSIIVANTSEPFQWSSNAVNATFNLKSGADASLTGMFFLNGVIAFGDTSDYTLNIPWKVTNLDFISPEVSRSVNGTSTLTYESLKASIPASVTVTTAQDWWQNSASTGGSDTQVQFNDGGAFGGDAGLTYNKANNSLSLEGDLKLNGTNKGIQGNRGDDDYLYITNRSNANEGANIKLIDSVADGEYGNLRIYTNDVLDWYQNYIKSYVPIRFDSNISNPLPINGEIWYDGNNLMGAEDNTSFNLSGLYGVSTETDLNNYTQDGKYLTPTSTLTNAPAGFAASSRRLIEVSQYALGTSNYIAQTLYSINDNKVAWRVYATASWSEWHEVPYMVDDVLKLQSTTNGTPTNGDIWLDSTSGNIEIEGDLGVNGTQIKLGDSSLVDQFVRLRGNSSAGVLFGLDADLNLGGGTGSAVVQTGASKGFAVKVAQPTSSLNGQNPEFYVGADGDAYIKNVLNLASTTNSSPTNGDIWSDGTNINLIDPLVIKAGNGTQNLIIKNDANANVIELWSDTDGDGYAAFKDSGGVDRVRIDTDSSSGYVMKVTGNLRLDDVLNLASTTNSSPTNGDVWYDSTNSEVTIQGDLKVNASNINFTGLPTSSAGLSAGDLWNDSGTLKIV